jgi:hypothetical protein
LTDEQIGAIVAVAKKLVVTAVWQETHLSRGTAEVMGVVTVEELRAFQHAIGGDKRHSQSGAEEAA